VRHSRRPTSGVRRDDQIRRINTGEVRYPGCDLPQLPDDVYGVGLVGEERAGAGLGPVRDTGLAIEGRVARSTRARQRSQRRMAFISVMALGGALLLAIGWKAASDRRASTAPLGGSEAVSVAAAQTGSASTKASSTAGKPADPHSPTPIFASYKSLLIRLPVPLQSLTEVGFHQASYGWALPMKTPLPNANLTNAAKNKSTGRDISKQPIGPNAVLIGSVLRMWRPRAGRPNTAADVGAKPGTVVLAPVSGTIVKIRPYKLYGKWNDYELHIQPTGRPSLDVVLIHLIGLTCHVGDPVVGGVTQLAHVRKLSDKFHDQLASYAKAGGNHVHIEVVNARDPKYKGLKGAIDPSTWHASGSVVATTSRAASSAY
jgi:hypothetical protein